MPTSLARHAAHACGASSAPGSLRRFHCETSPTLVGSSQLQRVQRQGASPACSRTRAERHRPQLPASAPGLEPPRRSGEAVLISTGQSCRLNGGGGPSEPAAGLTPFPCLGFRLLLSLPRVTVDVQQVGEAGGRWVPGGGHVGALAVSQRQRQQQPKEAA